MSLSSKPGVTVSLGRICKQIYYQGTSAPASGSSPSSSSESGLTSSTAAAKVSATKPGKADDLTAAGRQRQDELKLIIAKSFDESDGTYGYRRVHADPDWGVRCGLELMRKLMRDLDLVPCVSRGRGGTV